MNPKTENNSADPGVDLARFLNLPVYFFDLDSILADATTKPIAPDRHGLKSLAEHCLAQISSDEALIMAPTGFHLIVHSARGDAADTIAERVNSALLAALFGEKAAVPQRFAKLFRPLHARPFSAANEDGRPTGKSASTPDEREHGAATNESIRPGRESRDSYSELALRGRLPGQNVELLLEPVHDLLRGRSTTFFCTPAFCVDNAPVIRGYKAFQGVSQSELPYIDRAMLAHALKFARRLAQSGVYTTIGTPVSFETLTWSRGREFYQEALRAAGVPDYPSIVLSIGNLPLGITVSRLAELIGYLRPFAKRIFVQLPEADSSLLGSGYLGANGFVLSVPARQSQAQIERVAAWFARACEAQTALSCMDQIDNSDELGVVRRASVRFGLGSVFGPTQFRGNAEPIEIESFMRAAARAAQNEARNVHRLGLRRESGERTLRPH